MFAYGIGPTVYGHRYALLTGSGLNSSPPHFSGNLLGFLDRITNNGIVYGWACDSDAQDKSIKVHISLGTKEGMGDLSVEVTADETSEKAVADYCCRRSEARRSSMHP